MPNYEHRNQGKAAKARSGEGHIVELEDELKDLKRELKLKDERIEELKREIDGDRELIRRFEEHVKDRDDYLESFVTAFDMELNAENCWTWGSFVSGHNALVDRFNELRDRYNKLVRRFNANIADVQPIGRPVAASEAQQIQVLKLHKAGTSLRAIAEETSLGLQTVRTIITKTNGSDRATARRRLLLGLEPKASPRQRAQRRAIDTLPKRATAHLKAGRDLLKEAKGLK